MQQTYDTIVIGGGPGGSTAGTLMTKRGQRVLLLEKEVFPRFHIGESLLPYNFPIFDELGVMTALNAAGFPKKFGAQFELADKSRWVGFVFKQGRFTKHTQAMQVERAKFDHILLKNAAANGVEVREGWTVQRFDSVENGMTVQATGPQGEKKTFCANWLIDASGRGNLTGNQEGLREMHPGLKKLAVFGHYLNVRLDAGERAGDTVVIRLNNKWFWVIPVSAEKTSVGCVMDKEEFGRWKGSPEELFNHIVQNNPAVLDRMKNARRVDEVHVTADFSYKNRRLYGPRLLRVGDAAGFLDPIFSSGVFIAMRSAKLAVEAIAEATKRGNSAKPFQRYEKEVFAGMDFYWEMVEKFYTTPFMEIFMNPREKFDLPAAVNAALAGELAGNWSLRWRMRLFFLLVSIQARKRLAPAIVFRDQ
ncbi:MAG: NAD(P)/FAD-dependent oxidoreductase [Limisphaerales bacterium]